MIYVFLANGFEEIEALTPVDLLRRAGLDVQTVGVGGEIICGAHNIQVHADITADQLQLDHMSAIVLPGGMPGTTNLECSPIVAAAIECAVAQNKPIAAICAAPSILGKRGLLRGKRAVCYPGFESVLGGATVCDEGVVTDELITTAKGAGVAVDFALELIARWKSPAASDEIRGSIQCL